MSLTALEKLIPFEDRPYIPGKQYDVMVLSDDDWRCEDLFGEEPETIRFHSGNVALAGDLFLTKPDGYGYYRHQPLVWIHDGVQILAVRVHRSPPFNHPLDHPVAGARGTSRVPLK